MNESQESGASNEADRTSRDTDARMRQKTFVIVSARFWTGKKTGCFASDKAASVNSHFLVVSSNLRSVTALPALIVMGTLPSLPAEYFS